MCREGFKSELRENRAIAQLRTFELVCILTSNAFFFKDRLCWLKTSWCPWPFATASAIIKILRATYLSLCFFFFFKIWLLFHHKDVLTTITVNVEYRLLSKHKLQCQIEELSASCFPHSVPNTWNSLHIPGVYWNKQCTFYADICSEVYVFYRVLYYNRYITRLRFPSWFYSR